MIDKIKSLLGDNFKDGDELVLNTLIDKVKPVALSISNNSERNVQPEIIDCVISLYLQRGTEDVKSRSEAGMSSTFKEAIKEMRENIISNGKRRTY